MANDEVKSTTPPYVHGAYFLLFLGLIITFLYAGKSIWVPIVVALLFAFLVMPVVRRLEAWNVQTWLASLTGVFAVVLSVIALVCFFSWQVLSFVDDLPAMEQALEIKKKALYKFIEINFDISRREQSKWWEKKTSEMFNSGVASLMSIFTATGVFFANVVLIPVFMFFLLLYREKFKHVFQLLDPDYKDNILEIVRKISRVSQQYIRGIFIVILILTALNSIGFLLLGLKYAVLLAFMAAVLNIVPYVGVLIGSLLPVVIALVTKDSVLYALAAFGICTFVQFLENNFITPNIVGPSVNLNPLASIVALLSGALIWGLPGMILAIPLAGMFKVVCDNVASLHPLGFVLGEEKEYKPFRFKRVKMPFLKKSTAVK